MLYINSIYNQRRNFLMKKFITTSPYQPKGKLQQQVYHAVDNSKLQYNKPISFPILAVINGYTQKGDNIEVITIKADYINAENNYKKFQSELDELAKEKNFTYTLKTVDVPYNDELDTQLEIFQKLIDLTEDNDTLYTCISYGSKPTPLIENLALNYAYRIKKDVSIECMVYGAIDFNTKQANIYDITSLFYMDEIVRILAENKVSNPSKHIKTLLNNEI